MKNTTTKKNIRIIGSIFVLIIAVGIFGLLLPTRAGAIPATAVTLTATDGTQTVLTSDADASGAGYGWDADTATLTLNGYSGRSIFTNGDINLHLIGNNTLTLDSTATSGTQYGINLNYADGTATITADEGGTLNIVGDLNTYFSAVSGTTILNSGTLNIDITTASSGFLYAFERNVSFDRGGTGRVEINVDIERTVDSSGLIYGFYNGMNIAERSDVEVNVDLVGSENDTVIAFNYLDVYKSSPRIVATADNSGGLAKYRMVVDSLQAMSLTEGGYVELNGTVGMNSIGSSTSVNTVTTTPENNDYIWLEYDNSAMYSGDYILSTLDGAICEKTVFEYSDTPAELKWVGENHISIPSGKVDDNFSVNLLAAIRGTSTYDGYYLKAQVTDGQLPEGLYIAYQGGLLNGSFSSPCKSGSVTILFTDKNGTPYDYSDDRSIEFTLTYGAVADKDRFLTVGDSDPVEMKTDGSGAGWSYDGDSKTLTLNGYNGGPITTDGVLNIHLKGNNTLTLTDEKTYGIYSTYSTGEVNISADAGGTLNIKTPQNYTKSFTGIDAAITMHSGTVNMDLSSDFTGDWSFTGIAQYGYLGFTDSGMQKSWNVKVRNNADPAVIGETKVRLYGNYNNSLRIENCSDIEMNIDVRGNEFTETHGLYSLIVYNSSPDITVFTDNNGGSYDCFAIDGISSINLAEGGRLDLTGTVYANSIPYSQSPNTVTTTPENNSYFWKDTDPHYYYEDFYMADKDGNILDRIVFEYSEEQTPLKWMGGTNFDIPAGAVGDYIGLNLWAGLRGGNSPTNGSTYWSFEILEGRLPGEIDFSSYTVYNGRLNGRVTVPTTAGYAKIRATDKAGTYDTSDDRSVEFTISYGAFNTNHPVSGLAISKDTITLDNVGTGEILATVTPSDAAYPYVEAIVEGGNGDISVSVGEPVGGVSIVTIKSFGTPGTYTVRIRTVELGLTKTLTVNVKEASPNLSINYIYERLTGLQIGATYKITGGGINTQFTADDTIYSIPEAWFGKTLNIVRVNGGDLDSAAQVLAIPARPAAPTGVEKTDASSFQDADGELFGLDNTMQYKSSSDDGWIYCWTSKIYLGQGSYDVRYAPTNTSFASNKVTLNIGYGKLAFEDRVSFDIPEGYSSTTWGTDLSPAVSGGKAPYTYSIDGPSWITVDADGYMRADRPAIDVAATTAKITVTDADLDSKTITVNVGTVTVPHVCKFDQQVTTPNYLESSADCTNKAKYRYSCTCGAMGSTSFEYGEPLGHNYAEKIVDNAHLKEKASDCQHFDSYWYDCTRCASISSERSYFTQTRGSHNYSQGFDHKVAGGHAHICTVQGCGAIDTLIPHTPGPEATEHNPQICTVCEFVIVNTLAHVHKPQNSWSRDEDSHWHECVGTDGYRFDEAEHSYDDVCDKDCNICGAIRVPTSHVEEATWIKDADSHKLVHNCCGTVVVAEEAHSWTDGVCSDCAYACQHTDANHDHICDVCDATVGTHQAAAGKHTCDHCGKPVTQCNDENTDHKCDVCGAAMGTHEAASGKHNCNYCGKPVSECIDANTDHKCDICGASMGTHQAAAGKHTCSYCNKTVTECLDDNTDHMCDVCGTAMGTHEAASGKHNCNYCGKPVSECIDANTDHKCDICGASFGTHEAASGKHTCDHCGKVVTDCLDLNTDHKCDVCDATFGTHQAAAGKHTCDHCGKTVTECQDLNSDHKCDTCGVTMGTHEAADGKHTCDWCGKAVTDCSDGNGDSLCDVCGKKLGDCIDDNKDHRCDKHGENMGVHEPALGMHICSYCGRTMTECEDTNRDHKCDTCGATVSDHEPAENGHICGICGATVSQCKDENSDHKCDVCGATLGECADENSDHKCDVCGAILGECADENSDHKCDVCGATLGECADENSDHKCDVCGAILGECADGDGNGKCDICNKDLGTPNPHEHVYVEGRCECGAVDPDYVPPHEHKFGDWICEATALGKHYRECECGERENGDCQWDDGKITLEPDYDTYGEKTYTCTLCGGTKKESIDKLVSVDEIVSPDNENIKVEVPAGSNASIAAGTIIDADEVMTPFSSEVKANIETVAGKGAEIIIAYDLSLLLDGAEVQPDGMIKVTVPAPIEASKYESIKVVYIDSNGVAIVCETTVNADGTVSFLTNHFSRYAVIGVPKNSPNVIVILALVAVVLGVGGFLGFRLAGKKNSLGTPESEAPESPEAPEASEKTEAPEKPEENPDNSSEEE